MSETNDKEGEWKGMWIYKDKSVCSFSKVGKEINLFSTCSKTNPVLNNADNYYFVFK